MTAPEVICVDGEWYWLPTDPKLLPVGAFATEADARIDLHAAQQVAGLGLVQ